MKKIFLFLAMLSVVKANSQTLSTTAQALYDEFYNDDVVRGQYSVTNGAEAIGTADGNSFYLKWIPANSTPASIPMLVTLHGSSSNVFNEFYLWHQYAAAKGVGIIALQWYRGAASVTPNDYFDDNTLYSYIDTALQRIHYPSGKAFYHGFSRGSARSYAIAFKDVHQPGGKNYFCTILSNAGKADSTYALYAQINSGMYGHTFYTGKKWAMYCGGADPDPNQNGCPGMATAKTWVEANGGIVGLYLQNDTLGHGGFHQTPAYINSALDYYLSCYQTSNIDVLNNSSSTISVFPNPSSNYFSIQSSNSTDVNSVVVYNELLQSMYTGSFVGSTTLNTLKWQKGIYFYEIISSKSNKSFGKIIIQ